MYAEPRLTPGLCCVNAATVGKRRPVSYASLLVFARPVSSGPPLVICVGGFVVKLIASSALASAARQTLPPGS